MYSYLKYNVRGLSILTVYLVIAVWNLNALGQSDWYKSSAFCDGEWLKYKVKWGIICLGTIEIFQEKARYNNLPTFRVMMHAKSVNLPFINVFFINEGYLNPYHPTLQHFTLTSGKEAGNVTTYVCNPQSKTILMKTVEEDQIIRLDSLIQTGAIYDALGIFMSIRCLSVSGFNISLKNIVEFKISQTYLNFSGDNEKIKVSAFDDRQDALKFSGRADWVGKSWAGVTGPFHGWISHDSCAIPLKVQIKIFLGSITLELEDFKRNNNLKNSPDSAILRN